MGAMSTETLHADKSVRIRIRPTFATAVFKGGTDVTLREDETVSSGTLAHNTSLDTVAGANVRTVEFKGERAVTFREDGTVSSGTLLHDTSIDTVVGAGMRRIEFK